MILLQDDIDIRPVKVDWYWSEKKPEDDDGSLREVDPYFIMRETTYIWSGTNW